MDSATLVMHDRLNSRRTTTAREQSGEALVALFMLILPVQPFKKPETEMVIRGKSKKRGEGQGGEDRAKGPACDRS